MPAETGKVYECAVCGNVVKVLEGSYGDLVCCGQNMDMRDE